MKKFAVLTILFGISVWGNDLRSLIGHIIVVYLENRSFDNLFHDFEGADTSDHPSVLYLPQRDERGRVYEKIAMGYEGIRSGLPTEVPNCPFTLDAYLPHDAVVPDMVHRFYQNRLQIDGGTNERFVQISDGGALVMGYHDMRGTSIWRYAKEFTLCDRFFAAAFGGSFLNHQWLIAARTPYAGNTGIARYELSEDEEIIRDGILTPDGFAVNTIQPFYPPYKAKYSDPAKRLPPLSYETIGDRLSDRNISWGWYSGGYDDALAGRGEEIDYQYHHNPFLYFERYAPGQEGRKHLRDEKDFFEELSQGRLPAVVFFKPSAEENQHPGYASIEAADKKLTRIVEAVRSRPEVWSKSVIIVTYDENGGFWDHTAPPRSDRWGPGTRIPAVVISPFAKKGFIDHTEYDTTSILRLIEWRYGLNRLGERNSANMLSALQD